MAEQLDGRVQRVFLLQAGLKGKWDDRLHDSDDPDTVDSQFAKRIGHLALAAARELINGCNDLRDSKADCQAASGCLSVVDHMRDHFSKGFLAEMEDEESFIEGIR